jgi:hypothetical protein
MSSSRLLKKASQRGRSHFYGGGWDTPLLAYPSLQKVIGGRAQLGLSQPPPSFFSSLLDVEAEVDNIRFFKDLRVAPSWAPKRAERGPYTGRGASTIGLLGDRTRNLVLHIESKIHDIGFFNNVVFAFKPE